jgi:spore coat polysaccharide biosynthesis protein SpsF
VRVVAVVQARCGSSRLPGKVLRPLAGDPVIAHVLRAALASNVADVVLATTSKSEDDRLPEIAATFGVRCFRGATDDVLGRFCGALAGDSAEAVVRLTGDDPLLDCAVIDKVISTFEEKDCDYASNILERTWPRGLDAEVISRDALERANREGQRVEDREHVTIFVRTRPDLFRLENVRAREAEIWPELRLCIDTEEDEQLLEAVFRHLHIPGKAIPIGDIIHWLRARPDLVTLNAHVQQKPTLGRVF